jgi:hypothetical protein
MVQLEVVFPVADHLPHLMSGAMPPLTPHALMACTEVNLPLGWRKLKLTTRRHLSRGFKLACKHHTSAIRTAYVHSLSSIWAHEKHLLHAFYVGNSKLDESSRILENISNRFCAGEGMVK